MNSIPVTVLGGFLGAGKTTLLNHILRGNHGLRFGVLVNDFGRIDVDSQLIIRLDGESLSLANGCVCCTIRGDLVRALRELLTRDPPPEHVLIEASGVAEPGAIGRTVQALEPETPLRLESVLLVVDAENFPTPDVPHHPLVVRQLLDADLVLLNKTDLVEPRRLEQVRAAILEVLPEARIVPCLEGKVPLPLVIGAEAVRPEVRHRRAGLAASGEATGDEEGCASSHEHDSCHAAHPTHPDHGQTFETCSLELTRPFDLRRLREVVRALPPGILRVKGVIQLARWPEKRAILQVVGRRAQVRFDRPWEAPPSTRIVFIGLPGSVDPVALREQLEAATTDPLPPLEDPLQALLEWFRERWI